MGLVAFFQQEILVFQRGISIRNYVKLFLTETETDTQSRHSHETRDKHDNTWKLETEPRQNIQVLRLSQDRGIKTCLETVSSNVLRLHP